MPKPPTAPVVAAGLVGGFAIARYSGRRELGGLFYAACGAWSARQWARRGGPSLTLGLGLTYVAAFGVSHPLAKRIGAWLLIRSNAYQPQQACVQILDRVEEVRERHAIPPPSPASF